MGLPEWLEIEIGKFRKEERATEEKTHKSMYSSLKSLTQTADWYGVEGNQLLTENSENASYKGVRF